MTDAQELERLGRLFWATLVTYRQARGRRNYHMAALAMFDARVLFRECMAIDKKLRHPAKPVAKQLFVITGRGRPWARPGKSS